MSPIARGLLDLIGARTGFVVLVGFDLLAAALLWLLLLNKGATHVAK